MNFRFTLENEWKKNNNRLMVMELTVAIRERSFISPRKVKGAFCRGGPGTMSSSKFIYVSQDSDFPWI